MAEIEILGVAYDRQTFRRVIDEGYTAYLLKGPHRLCPYGSDQRNGAWCFGAAQAKKGYSRKQAWQNFKRQESLT